MEAQAFWRVIGMYNQSTWLMQIIILALLVISLILAYAKKIVWAPKIALGVANMFIGTGLFLCYKT